MEPSFNLPPEDEITQKLIGQHVKEKYHKEAIDMIQMIMRRKECTLEEALRIVLRFIKLSE